MSIAEEWLALQAKAITTAGAVVRINLDAGELMKMGELHVAPLATQAIETPGGMLPLTGTSRFVFPSSCN